MQLLDPRKSAHRTNTSEEVTSFFEAIEKTNPTPVLFKSVEGMRINPTVEIFKVLEIACDVSNSNLAENEQITLFLMKLCFSETQRESLEKITRGHNGNSNWMEAKKGRIDSFKIP